MAEETVEHYRRYFEGLQGTEHAKNRLINELLTRLETIEEQYRATRMDYDREIQYNRQGQVKEMQMAQELKDLRSEAHRDPFVLVLLDGDGMIFEESMLERGEAGGKDAANELWTQTREYIHRVQQQVPLHFKIVARTYANLKGLGDTCHRAGILRHPSFIEEFARGFTGSKQLFDFVDVGSGKDRADEKITEILRLHLNNRSCQHVVFGGSHDNGYARLLEEIPYNNRSKITLLEGVPFERELRNFASDFEMVKFGNLFRPTKIVAPMQPITRTITGESRANDPTAQADATRAFANGKTSTNGSASSTSSPRNVSAQPNTVTTTWAGKVTSAPSPPQEAAAAASQQALGPPQIPRNKFGQRIDPALTNPDPFERQRVAKIKMCNVHYLQRACPYGDTCTHDHSYKPSKSELEILRYMNRLIPCRNGTACDEPKCMYGHRCQRSVEGVKKCQYGNNCRFGPEMHGLDTRVVKTTVV